MMIFLTFVLVLSPAGRSNFRLSLQQTKNTLTWQRSQDTANQQKKTFKGLMISVKHLIISSQVIILLTSCSRKCLRRFVSNLEILSLLAGMKYQLLLYLSHLVRTQFNYVNQLVEAAFILLINHLLSQLHRLILGKHHQSSKPSDPIQNTNL